MRLFWLSFLGLCKHLHGWISAFNIMSSWGFSGCLSWAYASILMIEYQLLTSCLLETFLSFLGPHIIMPTCIVIITNVQWVSLTEIIEHWSSFSIGCNNFISFKWVLAVSAFQLSRGCSLYAENGKRWDSYQCVGIQGDSQEISQPTFSEEWLK